MGIPTDIFVVQPPDTNLVCVICHDVFEDPVSLQSCGHTFCKSCIDQVPGTACPTCRHDTGSIMVNGAGIFGTTTPPISRYAPNLVARGMVSELQIRCKLNHQYQHPGIVITGVARGNDSRSSPAYHHTTTLQPRGKRLRLERSTTDGDDDVSPSAGSSGSSNHHACNGGCNWIGKVCDWELHAQRDCPLYIVTCSVIGCSYTCARKDLQQHQIDYMTQHCNNIVDSKLLQLENKLARQRTEYELQVQQLETKSRLDLVHYHLTNICRSWCEHRPKALDGFLLCRPRIVYYPYNTEPHARMNKLLCGIPGPTNTPWEGGILPLLLTWQDVHRPPICQFPAGFYHANVFKSTGAIVTTMYREKQWHAEITLPEILFNIQQLLAHPKRQSTSSSSTSATTSSSTHISNRPSTSPTTTITTGATSGGGRATSSPSPLQHHPVFPTQGQQHQHQNYNASSSSTPATNTTTTTSRTSSSTKDAYQTFLNDHELYNETIRTMVKEKYWYTNAEEFLTNGIASPEVRRFMGNATNWRLVDGCRTTWKRDWQTLEYSYDDDFDDVEEDDDHHVKGHHRHHDQEQQNETSNAVATTSTNGVNNDSTDRGGKNLVTSSALSPLRQDDFYDLTAEPLATLATAAATSDRSAAAAASAGAARAGGGPNQTLPCPCSCCKHGKSFWDERHEMRFFFGSGL